jgi:hypothetical protein
MIFDSAWVIPLLAVKEAFAGAAGGLVRWSITGDAWEKGISTVLIGAICGRYLAPLAGQYLGRIDSSDPSLTSAFVIGLGGSSIAAALIQYIQDKIGGGK